MEKGLKSGGPTLCKWVGHAGEASLGPALSADWISSKRPGIAIPSQHPSPIPTTDAGGDCHGRSAVSPATRGETTTRAECRRASRWRPEKAAPENSVEGVPARLGTGEDAHGRSAAPPAARGSPAPPVLEVGATPLEAPFKSPSASGLHVPERLERGAWRNAGGSRARGATRRGPARALHTGERDAVTASNGAGGRSAVATPCGAVAVLSREGAAKAHGWGTARDVDEKQQQLPLDPVQEELKNAWFFWRSLSR
ncbi:uncharacterized protein [Triticum aestivum]|uniref:uncharacterized protein n=1 Tax=Triticum aestivum TaxID=4565 RepID=UPI001D0026F4|nr:uncharacterized protein LOC123139202 [Triticum aestivum]